MCGLLGGTPDLALLISDALIKALEERGYPVTCGSARTGASRRRRGIRGGRGLSSLGSCRRTAVRVRFRGRAIYSARCRHCPLV